jgi:hypothetical protein
MVGIADILGAGASIFGAFSQRGSEREANRIAAENVGLSREVQQALLELSERGFNASIADVISARGDRTTYDEEAGVFRSIPSPQTAELLRLSDAAEAYRLGPGETMRQTAGVEDFDRRRQAGYRAGELGEQMRESPYTREGITADLSRAATRGVQEGFDPVQRDVARVALRRGVDAPDVLGRLGRERGLALSDALLNARIQGPTTFENLEGARADRLGSDMRFNQNFASGIPNPTNLTTAGGSLANTLAGRVGAPTGAAGAAGQLQAYGGSQLGASLLAQANLRRETPNLLLPSLLMTGAGLATPTSAARERTASGNTSTYPIA